MKSILRWWLKAWMPSSEATMPLAATRMPNWQRAVNWLTTCVLLTLVLVACVPAATRSSAPLTIPRVECDEHWVPVGLPDYPVAPVGKPGSLPAWQLYQYNEAQQAWGAVVIQDYRATALHLRSVAACLDHYRQLGIIR